MVAKLAIVEEGGVPHPTSLSIPDPQPGGVGGSGPRAEPAGNAIPKRKRCLANRWQVIIRLGLSFALLIGTLLGLGLWVSSRVATADLILQNTLARTTTKLQVADEALRHSGANSRITMQILVQKSATLDLLSRRAQNTLRISQLISALEEQCDSAQEKELLLTVKQTREPYVSSYKRALHLLLDEKDPKMAETVMLEQATPALFTYHAAWHDFEHFELQQIRTAAAQSSAFNRETHRFLQVLNWLTGVLAAAIAVFTTRRMARDIKLRTQMQAEVSSLNAELERKVTERTEELARADTQLRESLAETQEYAREVEAVNRLVQLLQSCLTQEEAHQQAACVLKEFFPAGSVLLLNPSRNLLDAVISWGAASTAQGPFLPESCWALRKGQVHVAGPHCHNPLCAHISDTRLACHLCLPMMAQGKSLGVLSIDDTSFCGNPRALERKQKLAITLSEQISLAFANLALRETLKYQSVRDPLTGLFNRRYMEEMLERELLRAARKTNLVTVLMIDIDHFKEFNDAYGHEAGDLLLRELGSVLKGQIRGGDIACRYGGEEFLLILTETGLEAGRERAENLRQQLGGLHIHYHGEVLRRITASIGVAGYPEHGTSAARIVSSADGALYQAKHEGRDRVVVAAT